MDVKELRIGNLIELPTFGGGGDKIFADLRYGVVVVNAALISDAERLGYDWMGRPIKLNEEWLTRFDMIKKNFTTEMPESFQRPDVDDEGNIWYYWVKGAFNLEIKSNGEIWFEVYSHYIHVKYVHQLQNLYYMLTGVELIIK